MLTRFIHHPGENHCFVRLQLHRLRKRRDLARLYIVGNALDVFKRAMLLPDLGGFFGKLFVSVDIALWQRQYKTVDIFANHVHRELPFA